MSGEGTAPEPSPSVGAPGTRSIRGVCGILVTYNPEPRLLEAVLSEAVTQLDHLIVFDNGSRAETVDHMRRLAGTARALHGARITEHYYPSNLGLPIRFNEALRIAKGANDRFALFLDQDSVLEPGAVERLLHAHDRVTGRLPIEALEARNVEPVVLPTDDFLAGYWRRRYPPLEADLTDDLLGTNSGLFLPLEVIDRVGGFDESYFLDAVDFEFTLRLRSKGGRVLQVPTARIQHQRGELDPGSDRAPTIRRVQPFRHYYVARDVFRTWARYWRKFPVVGMLLLSMPFREAVLVLLFYRDRRTHLRFLALGTVHALRGITGPMPGSGTRDREG